MADNGQTEGDGRDVDSGELETTCLTQKGQPTATPFQLVSAT